ncbi:OPT family oligopeptide transporter [Selenihalanaerobacter shriftii]|uniref:Putative oligopeptide transporter, OPT family n=1 Tax=Selenihalanaerobacter shriftii TaxID=142842 RepID=A0A1T4QR68_9FIRM|nr:oligopeptide transporter, OPT family [Selenihalanaerobacter shriftii]SKA06195.1 putative oligopeptide transporter, OPT family [Selenihalanaerobacter shriftii]
MSQKETNQEHKPYVAADKSMSEFTITSIILGVIMTVVFAAANAYLGLKVGMTVSASVPGAVISMGILRGVLNRGTILENNTVQTITSAGTSLAAGVIFTIPALILLGVEPSMIKMFLIALFGGVLGVLFMIPLRKYLIVEEHGNLPYPEGTACAEVLIAGEEGGAKSKYVFAGMGIGAIYKFLSGGMKVLKESVEWAIPGYQGSAIGFDLYPSLLGVGYIIGPKIAVRMLAGGTLGWFVLMPLITNVGAGLTEPLFPASQPISELGYWGVWDNYIRYVGAGGVALGGVVSLIKALPTILESFKAAVVELTKGLGEDVEKLRTDIDLPIKWVVLGALAVVIAIAFTPLIPVGVLGAVFVAIFGFFFVTVSSRIVGIVGSSSNPASGMTIATLLATSLIMKAIGWTDQTGMVAALSVGAIVCVAIAVAGDTSQDLKTGFLVGATPKKQQLGELIGILVSAIFVGGIVLMLHEAYGIASKDLPAPQANLMAMVVKGVMKGDLPWALVFTGAFSSLIIEMFGIGSLPFAVGLYLPIHLSTPIMIGGLIKAALNRKSMSEEERSDKDESGILFASGLVAGDALIGILLAALALKGWHTSIDIGVGWAGSAANILALGSFCILAYLLWKSSVGAETRS